MHLMSNCQENEKLLYYLLDHFMEDQRFSRNFSKKKIQIKIKGGG